MSIVEKVFKYEENEISVIKCSNMKKTKFLSLSVETIYGLRAGTLQDLWDMRKHVMQF